MAGFLTEIHVEGFGCLKDVTCPLTPLHAFIGPNDSGKSTLLRFVQSLSSLRQHPTTRFLARFADGSDLGNKSRALARDGTPGLAARFASRELGAELVRLDADALRLPGSLIQLGQPLVLQGRGTNMASLYDALRDRSITRFARISEDLKLFFPSVASLGLRATGPSQKVLAVTLVDGTEVLSSGMSEGLLYYLAFAILGELQRPAVYLVEEPENGLHPSRIRDIVRILRSIAEGPDPVQVLMATHSPLVVNELRPEEVTVVTRDPVKGTELRPIKETPHFAERSKVYALGELWLSYADGKVEAPLFDPEGR